MRLIILFPLSAWLLSASPAIAQNPAAQLADKDLEARQEPVYRHGRLEGAPWETFGDALELGFDAGGRLYVLDRDNLLLHTYSKTGRHRWTAGGRGGGPGEFSGPTRLVVLPDGRTVVADLGHRGLLLFDSAGSYLDRLDLPDGLLPAAIHAAEANGVFLLPVSSMVTADSLPIFLVRTDGPTRVIGRATSRGPRVVRTDAGLRRILPPTFSPSLQTAGVGGKLAIADDAGYVIKILGSGEPVRLRRPIPPRAVTEADRTAAREEARQRAERTRPRAVGGFRTLPSNAHATEARVRAMTFADTLPVVQGIRGSPDGFLWVARSGPVALQPGPIDVFAPNHRYQGTLSGHRIPDALGPGGLAAWVEADDLGVPFIRVARLRLAPHRR